MVQQVRVPSSEPEITLEPLQQEETNSSDDMLSPDPPHTQDGGVSKEAEILLQLYPPPLHSPREGPGCCSKILSCQRLDVSFGFL